MQEKGADDVEGQSNTADDKHKFWLLNVYGPVSRTSDLQMEASRTPQGNKSLDRL